MATAHDQFKVPELWAGLPLVVDTRNMVAGLFAGEGKAGPVRVVKA